MADNKVGLDYFELLCHMEEKVRLIQAEFGLKGFAVVVKLYQKIYGEFGYYCEWSEDSLLLFMSENGVPSDSKNLIQEIVLACIRRNIFSESLFNKFGILTSSGVQKRYMKATSRREKVIMKKEYLLLSDDKINPNVVIIGDSVDIIEENADRIAQSRVKKSREDKSNKADPGNMKSESPSAYFPDDALLNQTFLDFMDMRKKIKKPMTDRAVTMAINKLQKLSGGDNELSLQILEQSILNCWQDLYPLKEDKRKSRSNGNGNNFNNFCQNQYDFEQLERDLLSN